MTQDAAAMSAPSAGSAYRSPFDVPPQTEWNVISLGGGVQSSCIAMMAASGEITPMPQAAIFADTQGEPKAVYDWMDWLEKQVPFPVIRVTAGNLADAELEIRTSRTSGKKYRKARIPAFGRNPDGSRGILGRKCTADFKIEPIRRHLRRMCGISRGQKECTVTQWIGISYDEMGRARASHDPWCQMRFPLLERDMTRDDCLAWMKSHGHPEPPRSACLFCPFHSDHEWTRIKAGDKGEWDYVQEFERRMQSASAEAGNMRAVPFLHPTLVSIGDVEFRPKPVAVPGQKQLTMHAMWNDIKNDCSGMCGV
jgi:hypothetical protein